VVYQDFGDVLQEFRLIQKYAADPVGFSKKASDDDISPIDLERGLHGIVTGCLFGMMQLRGLFFYWYMSLKVFSSTLAE
jgi:hypothetical protein